MADCARLMDRGASGSEVVAFIADEEVSVVERMKVVRQRYGIPLGVAKRIVTTEPAWLETVRASRGLHEDALQVPAEGEDV